MEQWLWSDFWLLSTERQYGECLGPIPHSKIIEYYYRERDFLSRSLFVDIIRSMDACYIAPKDEG